MRTDKIKEKLISEIEKSNDKELLKDISTLFKSRKSERKVLKLSKEQMVAIQVGIGQIERGEATSHEDFMKEVDEWLKEK